MIGQIGPEQECANISTRTGNSVRLVMFLLGMALCMTMLTGVAGSLEAARAIGAPSSRTNINPGLLYWQAFGALPKLEEGDRKKLDEFSDQVSSWSNGSSVGWAVTLPPESDALLKRYKRSLRLLQQARLSTTPCDWGADFADGPEMLVPDTRGLRELTKVSLLQAAVQLQAKSYDESVDTLLSCLALVRQSAKDGTLVSVMLQQILEAKFVDYLGAELGRYPASAIVRLQQGLTQLPPRAPVLRAVEGERTLVVWWTLGQIDRQVEKWSGDDGKAYRASRDVVLELFGGDPPHDKEAVTAVDAASGSSVNGLRNLLNDLGAFYDEGRTIAAAGPGSVSQAAAVLEQHVETSSNPICRMLIPNFRRARTVELCNLSRWAMMEASVAEVSGGQAAFLEISDPLAQAPFQVITIEQGVVELRSRTNLGNGFNPVLRVMKKLESGQ
jgi:hypothetical protein